MIQHLENSEEFLGATYHLDFRNNPLNPTPRDWILIKKAFHLDTTYVNEQRGSLSWQRAGEVPLPFKQNFATVIVDVEESLAEQIKILDLNSNPVMKVDKVEKLKGVKELFGYRCGFSSVPSWIGKLPSVEIVYLFENDITQIPPFVSRMENLRNLDLSKNIGLRSFPKPGENLTELSLAGCDIQVLSPDFFNHHLVKVDMSGNRGEAKN